MFRAKTTFEALARDSVQAYLHGVTIVREPLRSQLFSSSLRNQLGGYNVEEVFRHFANKADTDDPLSLVQYLDLHTYLIGDINTKVDRASMAHSLEVREPLMDHPLVEWLGTLPSSFKIRGSNGKALLKKSMEKYLPHDILYRPKMGFAVPLDRWFRGPLRQRVRDDVLNGTLASSGYFNHAMLEHIIDAHQSGKRDYSGSLWALVMFEAFLRNIENPRTAEAPLRQTA
jgi:asparagine synthase (glutamine-hydrolysing)